MRAPPLKCQGIKTKLAPFIAANVAWDGKGIWIEPFAGSGAVAFNLAPGRALLCDANPHPIRLYQGIQAGSITPGGVGSRLTEEGRLLLAEGEVHYRRVRDRFNLDHDPVDYLFLNRACFNGLVRFNRQGEFNVPFCRKPDRFRPGYVTKIVRQVQWVRDLLAGREWTFACQDWRVTLDRARAGDFVYLDPPYPGRFSGYFNAWTDKDANDLARRARALPCGMALSMWEGNRFRANPHLERWTWADRRSTEHFYHLGATADLRHAMTEALLVAGPLPTCGS